MSEQERRASSETPEIDYIVHALETLLTAAWRFVKGVVVVARRAVHWVYAQWRRRKPVTSVC